MVIILHSTIYSHYVSGNSGSAFVEVLVKSSHDAEYISLLPQSILMSSEESRSGRNHMRIKVFSKGKHQTDEYTLANQPFFFRKT